MLNSKITLVSFVFILFSILNTEAQEYYKGKVVNNHNQGLPFCSLSIINKNMQIISDSNTDSIGLFQIKLPEKINNQYNLVIKEFGYQTKNLPLHKALNLSHIILEELNLDLKEVEITAKRPQLIQEKDYLVIKKVFDNKLAKGKNAVDFLRFVPTINVGIEDNISFQDGKKMKVYINGKRSNTPLGAIPAERIEKIELIRNPGPKYSASTLTGIINVVLRKNENERFSHYLNFQDKQKLYNNWHGRYFLNFNKKNTKISTILSFFRHKNYDSKIVNNQYLMEKRSFSSDIWEKESNESYWVSIYLDQKISSNQQLLFGFEETFYKNRENSNIFDHFISRNNICDSTVMLSFDSKMNNFNQNWMSYLSYNLNINPNNKLELNVYNYNRVLHDKTKNYKNQIVTETLFERNYTSFPKRKLKAWISEINYTHKFSNQIELNGGVSYNTSFSDNSQEFYRNTNNKSIKINSLSSKFNFEDSNFSSFVKLDFSQFKKWNASFGIRSESYSFKGKSYKEKEQRDICSSTITGLFPHGFIYFKPNEKNQFTFNFSKQINRPSYNSYNPSINLVSLNNFAVGNPDLLPFNVYDYYITYTFLRKHRFYFGYSEADNTIRRLTLPSEDGKIITSEKNIGSYDSFYIGGSLVQSFFNNYLDLIIMPKYSLTTYVLDIEKISSSKKIENYSVSVKTNLFFTKRKDFYLQGLFQYSLANFNPISKTDPTTHFYLIISKSFPNKMVFSMTYADYPTQQRSIARIPNFISETIDRKMYQQFIVSLSWSFGNSKVKYTGKKRNSNLEKRL
ncbi:MAG: outer membrane beta-barrel protein [Bacteroidales bacterium]